MSAAKQTSLGALVNGKHTIVKAKSKQSTLAFSQKSTAGKKTPDKKDTDGTADTTELPDAAQETSNSDLGTKHGAKARNSKRNKTEKIEDDEKDDSDDQPVLKRRRKATEHRSPTRIKSGSKGRGSAPPETAPKTADHPEQESGTESDGSFSGDAEEPSLKVEEKPVDTVDKHEKIQATLEGSGKDPYSDWEAGEPVPYAALCTTFSLIEMTAKRLEIAAHCSLFLQQVLRLTPGDLLSTIQLMINKVAADYAGIELGIGESLILKAISESTGRTLAECKADHHKIGDLGLVAAKSRSNQRTMFKPRPLTVKGVHQGLLSIATLQGHGAQERKVSSIMKLLSAADASAVVKGQKGIDISKDKGGASESKFLIRFLEGKLRLGLAERTVIVAVAQAAVKHEAAQEGNKAPSSETVAKGEAVLKSVYSELPSYEVIVPQMLQHGIFRLSENCKLQPGVPLKPMLAKPTKSITEVLDRFEGKDFTCEYKYDGERAQIHYVAPDSVHQYPAATSTLQKDTEKKGLSSIFSRNSEDLSKKYPDILAKLNAWIKPETKSFVLDCETVAWDMESKKVLPFQQLMTRKRKDVKAEDVKVKVCVFAFDILFHNGEATVQRSLRERRQLLHAAFEPTEGEFAFAQFGDTKDIEQIQTLLDESVKASCEGLMVKMLDTQDSGYEPSKRSRNWLKVKKDYLSGGIGDSLDLVVLGAYYGKGKRTSVYGAFLLAAYNPDTERYETVCNIGTGFSEAVLESLHSTLSQHLIDHPKPFYNHSTVRNDQPDVWFDATMVWEVKTADLTLSPRYRAAIDDMAVNKGISLRFPRFIRLRDDKKPEQATTTAAVAEMYRKQDSVGKEAKAGVDDDFEY